MAEHWISSEFAAAVVALDAMQDDHHTGRRFWDQEDVDRLVDDVRRTAAELGIEMKNPGQPSGELRAFCRLLVTGTSARSASSSEPEKDASL